MPRATFFTQECPTCGRRLEVRVEYLGKQVACSHCRAAFCAVDPSSNLDRVAPQAENLMERVDALIGSLDSIPSHPR